MKVCTDTAYRAVLVYMQNSGIEDVAMAIESLASDLRSLAEEYPA